MLNKLFKGLAPVFAIAATVGLSGCDGARISINDKEGVPLAELDTTGKTPTELVLAGPDSVIVTEGETLAIDVSGDPKAVEALRFTLDDSTLGIMRASEARRVDGKATVRVTMPTLETLVVAGSGTVEAPRLSGSPEVTIAGSGTARVARIEAEELDMTIAGSGAFEAAGTATELDLTVAGSGSANMRGLKVERADVTIAGSGSAAFASDGTVEAQIMGSGDVSVTGSAKCTINAMGSGTLRCSPAGDSDTSAPTAAATPAPEAGDEPPAATPPPAE